MISRRLHANVAIEPRSGDESVANAPVDYRRTHSQHLAPEPVRMPLDNSGTRELLGRVTGFAIRKLQTSREGVMFVKSLGLGLARIWWKASAQVRLGGRDGIRTHDPGVANAVLSQLSYSPTKTGSFTISDRGSAGRERTQEPTSGDSAHNRYSVCPLRRFAQYFFIRSETSCRSLAFIDFLPRRLPLRSRTGAESPACCNSSNEAITRSSFSFSAYKS